MKRDRASRKGDEKCKDTVGEWKRYGGRGAGEGVKLREGMREGKLMEGRREGNRGLSKWRVLLIYRIQD